MRRFDLRHIFAASLVLAIVGVAALFAGIPQPARAQLTAQGTGIPASGVGGTANAVTLAVPNIRSMNDLLWVPLRFKPLTTNAAGGTTINVNGYGTENVLRSSLGVLVAIAGGDLTTGSGAPFAEVVWDGTQFVQSNPATGSAPVGTEAVFVYLAGSTITSIPGYLIENGQCVSETTYPALWASYGGTDIWSPGSTGSACSSGNFHVKFANGRASVAANNQAGQTGPLTLCTAGTGNLCGAQALAQSALPNVAPGFTGSPGTATSQNAGYFDYSNTRVKTH